MELKASGPLRTSDNKPSKMVENVAPGVCQKPDREGGLHSRELLTQKIGDGPLCGSR
jgi:hypothetical protein